MPFYKIYKYLQQFCKVTHPQLQSADPSITCMKNLERWNILNGGNYNFILTISLTFLVSVQFEIGKIGMLVYHPY